MERLLEELREANERLVISGVRLQNTNQELEASKEELRSANKELNTLNEELRSRQEELRKRAQLLNLAHEPIIVRDLEGHILDWNKGAERLYGWTAEESVGTRIHEHLHTTFPTSREQALDLMHSQGYWEGELSHTTRHGSVVTVASRWTLQKDAAGHPVAVLETNFDITDRKRSEAALRATEKLATMGRMAATLAHEINNPLESLTNLIYLAKTEPAIPKSVRNYLTAADEELSHIGQIAKQTLGLYRGSHSPQSVLVSDLLRNLVSVFSPRTKNKQIQINLEIDDKIEIVGVVNELRQVLANLLSNSIDAVNSGGRIRIRAAEAHKGGARRIRGVRITIADNGVGIPSADLGRIFEPFFTTKEDLGTGLGLWVSKEIVENQKGSIRIRSCTQPGRSGTVASVFLPSGAPNQGNKGS